MHTMLPMDKIVFIDRTQIILNDETVDYLVN